MDNSVRTPVTYIQPKELQYTESIPSGQSDPESRITFTNESFTPVIGYTQITSYALIYHLELYVMAYLSSNLKSFPSLGTSGCSLILFILYTKYLYNIKTIY